MRNVRKKCCSVLPLLRRDAPRRAHRALRGTKRVREMPHGARATRSRLRVGRERSLRTRFALEQMSVTIPSSRAHRAQRRRVENRQIRTGRHASLIGTWNGCVDNIKILDSDLSLSRRFTAGRMSISLVTLFHQNGMILETELRHKRSRRGGTNLPNRHGVRAASFCSQESAGYFNGLTGGTTTLYNAACFGLLFAASRKSAS